MDRLDDLARKRKEAHAKLVKLNSKVYRAFLEMEKAAYTDGALPKKTKELIAVGISVTIDCESCMQWHIEQAAESGATRDEIFEAVEVGIEMGGGPATVSSRFALEVIDEIFEKSKIERTTESSIVNTLKEVSKERIRNHIQALEGIRHPEQAPDALEHAADYIDGSFRSLGYKVEPHYFKRDNRDFRNIVATRRGNAAAEKREKRIIVMAHYDTVATSPGADDNASGIAVLLETAHLLNRCRFDRTLQFVAVNLEERQETGEAERSGSLQKTGLWGSRAFASMARSDSWDIEGVIVLEAVAYAGGDIPQEKPEELPEKLREMIPDYGNFITIVGNDHSAELVDAFTSAKSHHQLTIPILPVLVPGMGTKFPDMRRSDHSPFWDKGYKAVMLTDTGNFRNPHYHKPGDTIGTLNLPFAAEVCRLVCGVVTDLAVIV